MSKKLTRQRKWLLGVMGLGIAAVVVDRTLMGDPTAANASSAAADSEALLIDAADREADAPVPVAAPVAPGEGPLDLSDFSERLAGLTPLGQDASADRADAFAPPAAWVVQPLAQPEPGEPQAVSAVLTPAEFERRHELNGTMRADGMQIAVLDTKPYRVGQIVDGYVLRHVASRLAVWECQETGESVVLRESE